MTLALSIAEHHSSARGTTCVLTAVGDLDLHSAPELEAAIDEMAHDPRNDGGVVLDLGPTRFVDSSVLGVIVGADQRARAERVRFTVVCTNPNLMRVFELTRLDDVLAIVSSVEAAVA